ncbi:hypothetical protein BC831DRAFT_469659 [Entophlyctis helioformis]|nr:hypothetical protein BC831DRAFT_469659 [Entophlyctis helioformis]
MKFEAAALVERAERALESCEPQLAVKFLERALQQVDDHKKSLGKGHTSGASANADKSAEPAEEARIWQLLGWSHMETVNGQSAGDAMFSATSAAEVDPAQAMQSARHAFQKSIELAPGDNHEKYLYLGQLTLARNRLIQAIPIGPQADLAQAYRNKLGSALCSMTEIYMTDCCDEPEAESKCEEYMQHALEQNPSNPEVHQTLASVRLSQSRPEDASKSLQTSMDLWYREPGQGNADGDGDADMDGMDADADAPLVVDPNWPVYPVRIALSKLLMEVALHERALAVLQTCQAENDEDPEMWYLFGWCYLQLAQVPGDDNADYMDDAKECFESVLNIEKKEPGSADPEILQHIQQLLTQAQ